MAVEQQGARKRIETPLAEEKRFKRENFERLLEPLPLKPEVRSRLIRVLDLVDRSVLDSTGQVRENLTPIQIKTQRDNLLIVSSLINSLQLEPEEFLAEDVENAILDPFIAQVNGILQAYEYILLDLENPLPPEVVETEYERTLNRSNEAAARVFQIIENLNQKIGELDRTSTEIPHISFNVLNILLDAVTAYENAMLQSGDAIDPREAAVVRKFEKVREQAAEIKRRYHEIRNQIIENVLVEFYRDVTELTPTRNYSIEDFEFYLTTINDAADVPAAAQGGRDRLIAKLQRMMDAYPADGEIGEEVRQRGTELQTRVREAYDKRIEVLTAQSTFESEEEAIGTVEARVHEIMEMPLDNHDYLKTIRLKELEAFHRALELALDASDKKADEVPGYSRAKKRVEDALTERRNVKYLDWPEFYDEVQRLKFDLWKHGGYDTGASTPQDQYKIDLYNRFYEMKNEQSNETVEQRRIRLHYKTRLQLQRIGVLSQYENNRASCRRSDLMEQLRTHNVERDETIEATMCNEKYGMEIRTIIKTVMSEAVKKDSEIYYDKIEDEGNGRQVLEGYVKRVFGPELENKVASGRLTREDVNCIYEFSFALFYVYVLVDPVFAECQKQTKTKKHNKKDNDPIDRVLLSRPDAAAIHRVLRYSTYSDWSGWWFVYMPPLARQWFGDGDPRNMGPEEAKLMKLAEVQVRLQLHQQAHFPINAFAGHHHSHVDANGHTHHEFSGTIPWTSLFEPAFPDTYQYLLPARACAEVGRLIENKQYRLPEFVLNGDQLWTHEGLVGNLGEDRDVDIEVYEFARTRRVRKRFNLRRDANLFRSTEKSERMVERSMFDDAEDDWLALIQMDFKKLPNPASEHQILMNAEKGQGLVDLWLTTAGKAKVAPGNFLDVYMEPMLTHYIQRIFSVCYAVDEARQEIFEEVVKKLRDSYGEQKNNSGLGNYKNQIERVIRSISDPAHAPGEKIGPALAPYWYNRDARETYTVFYFEEKNWNYNREAIAKAKNSLSLDPRNRLFWNSVNLANGQGILTPEVNREGTLASLKDDDDHH